jgi:hypothetical protein
LFCLLHGPWWPGHPKGHRLDESAAAAIPPPALGRCNDAVSVPHPLREPHSPRSRPRLSRRPRRRRHLLPPSVPPGLFLSFIWEELGLLRFEKLLLRNLIFVLCIRTSPTVVSEGCADDYTRST